MVIKFAVDEKSPWFNGKFWPKGVPHQLDYDYNMSMRDLFERAVKNWPDNYFMWFLNTFVTYKQMKAWVDSFATALSNMGVKKGDVVAVHLPNSLQYIISFYAITSIGAIITGVNPTYMPAEILHQLKLTGAKYLVVLDALYFHYVAKIADQWDLKKVIWTNLVDLASGLSPIKKFLGKKLKKIPTAPVLHPNAVSFLECLKTPANVPKVDINTEKDCMTLIMTGGTTGVPKAAELTHMNCVANAKQCEITLLNQKNPDKPNETLGPKTCFLGVLPLYHSFAMTVVLGTAVAVGAWVALFPKPPPTEELIKEICTLPDQNGFIYAGAEILFQRIAELPDDVLAKYPSLGGRLKLCVSGAGPLHDYVREPFERKTGAKITEGYGLSESSPVASANNFYGERESGYIGVPFPSTDWKIFPADDFSKGPITKFGTPEDNADATGEICIAGPQVMRSYWQDPEQTADHLKEYGGKIWLLTGDIGWMDKYGRIKICDRKKQLIKMSGHSVFPSEVENLLGQNPKVLEVAVAGLPDPKLGEAVKAWVVIRPEAKGTITPEELLEWARNNMTAWKVPKYIEFIDEVPKNAIGKVMRRTLQEKDPLFVAKK